MEKDKLIPDGIKLDFYALISEKKRILIGWRMAYIWPFTLIAIISGIVLKNIWIGLAVFAVALYHIIRFIIGYNKCKKDLKAIGSIGEEQLTVSFERLTNVEKEMVYQPRMRIASAGLRNSAFTEVLNFCFESGRKWRVPEVDFHYRWSENYIFSIAGILNAFGRGGDFYYVSLKDSPDIAYVYPCDFFSLGEGLNCDIYE